MPQERWDGCARASAIVIAISRAFDIVESGGVLEWQAVLPSRARALGRVAAPSSPQPAPPGARRLHWAMAAPWHARRGRRAAGGAATPLRLAGLALAVGAADGRSAGRCARRVWRVAASGGWRAGGSCRGGRQHRSGGLAGGEVDSRRIAGGRAGARRVDGAAVWSQWVASWWLLWNDGIARSAYATGGARAGRRAGTAHARAACPWVSGGQRAGGGSSCRMGGGRHALANRTVAGGLRLARRGVVDSRRRRPATTTPPPAAQPHPHGLARRPTFSAARLPPPPRRTVISRASPLPRRRPSLVTPHRLRRAMPPRASRTWIGGMVAARVSS